MRSPAFWNEDGVLPRLLAPAASLYAAATAIRVARPGWQAPVPVICVGNASVGGSGKTPVALDLAARLLAQGRSPHFLSRGHGRRSDGLARVDPARHGAADVGDEPLLLAELAPCWVSKDRAAAARAAIAAGADTLIMDDGLQNPGLKKTLSFMVVDGGTGFGNGRVVPAGPLREPVAACAARVQAAIVIGPDSTRSARLLPPDLPVLAADIVPGAELNVLAGRNVLAFAGIGRPEKFFAMVRSAGLNLVSCHPFPDHHGFTPAELGHIAALAKRADAIAICTAKDHVRIPAGERAVFTRIGMSLSWNEPGRLDDLLAWASA
jgi:tetraacyldisaccharide 4'-kinase